MRIPAEVYIKLHRCKIIDGKVYAGDAVDSVIMWYGENPTHYRKYYAYNKLHW